MEAQLTEIDKLYFPHEWQKRFPFDQVLEEHIKFFTNGMYGVYFFIDYFCISVYQLKKNMPISIYKHMRINFQKMKA